MKPGDRPRFRPRKRGPSPFRFFLVFFFFFFFFLLPLPASTGTDAPSRPTSLLLITLDTTRADHLGCYGAAFASTPNLDALAARGVRFERVLSPAPLTLPSHVTMMTGLVPREHGVRDNALYRLGKDVPVLAERLKAAGYATAGFVSAAVLDRVTGIDRGFDHWDDNVRVGDRRAFGYEERAASQTTDAALDYLDRLEPPFFLWVHYFDPHLPYVPPEPFRTRFADRPYDGEIAFMDHEIGRLLAAVEKKEPQLLIFAAGDHGESLGEHGEKAHGVFLYQATQHVPMIVAVPGMEGGKTVPETVGLVELAPTALDLLGLPLMGPRYKARVYELETFFPRFAYGWSPLRALVAWPYKHVEAPAPELYDLEHDPGETHNLWADPPAQAVPLRRRLLELVGDDDPTAPQTDPDLAAQRERLEALGYVGGSAGAPDEQPIDPKQGIAWIADLDTARGALQGGRPADAVEPLDRLLARNPGNVPAWLLRVQCRLGLGDTAGAAEAAHRAVELDPDDPLTHFHLGNALAEKDAGAASLEYERALALNPRFVDAYLNYAAALERAGKPGEARALLLRARAEDVRDPDVETRLAVIELGRGDDDSARAAFERALALDPCAEHVHEALGRVAYGEHEAAEAALHYQRALDCEPTAAVAKTLGSIRLLDLDDRAGALAAFRQALLLTAPDDPEAAVLREMIETLEAAGP